MAKAAWLAGEAAILATALAELVGGAIALRLLFGLPLLGGVAVTGVGTFAVLALTRGNADRHERVIAVLLAIVAASFVFCCSGQSRLDRGRARRRPDRRRCAIRRAS